MGVLGILIQTEFGLPLYFEMFDPKLEKFQQMDLSLTAGFLTAITMFTKQFEMNLGHVKLHRDSDDVYGINIIASKMGEYLILCFVEPYLYHEVVKEKLVWIYDRILVPYEDQVKKGKIPVLTDEEKVWIGDILQNLHFKSLIASHKEVIDSILGILTMKYVGIYGISINSFDNSILYFSGIAEDTFKLFLNNLGRRSSIIKDYETIDSYVSIPEYQAMRVYAMNPGLKFEIQDLMTNLPERTVSFYYYVIADPALDIRPIISELIDLLDPFFTDVSHK